MIDELTIQLYNEGLSLREIGDATGEHPQALRKELIKLGLAIKKRDRAESFKAFVGRSSEVVKGTVEEIPATFLDEDDIMVDKLQKLERSLQHARNELNYHRAVKRKDTVEETIHTKYQEVIAEVLTNVKIPKATIHVNTTETKNIPDWGLVAVMSDIHLGEIVGEDVPDNMYNYEIANKRMDHFVDNVVNFHKQSRNLVIADLKDILKGVIHGGMWESEGSVIESISKAVEMYVKMLTVFAGTYESVHIHSTGSNHERLTEHIVTTNKHLDYGRLIDMMVKQIVEAKKLENVHLYSTDNGYNLVNINGANIALMHGDTLRTYKPTLTISRSKLQDTCLQIFGEPYRHAISGHTHEFVSCGNQYKGLNIVNGTMVGNTSYGLQSGFSAILPSQTIAFVEDDGSIQDVRAVQFDSTYI